LDDGFKGLLKGLKLKVTSRRLAVLEVMAREGVFLSAEQIWTKARGHVKNAGLPTVYRILEELVEAGVVARIHGIRQLYYYCSNERHHHHFVCASCGKVEDVDLCLIDVLEREVSGRIRGTLLSHTIELSGLCQRCTEQGTPG
jgi:Fur family zinc uptake transcriptional regulator/Fur family ferric uptake transcriptional regulator